VSAPTKLASFALALAVVFGGGYALGSALGPFDADTPAEHQDMEMDR
jgi:hypothetical protein